MFGDLQMDEVAFPIVLAHQLGRTGAADWDNVKLSADYVVAHGPRTPQERWENATGYSPATIAAEIAGLVCAADIATKNGDDDAAADVPGEGRRVAADRRVDDRHDDRPVQPGAVLPAHHQERPPRTPATQMQVSDGGPLIDERYVVDPSFLDLVRLGVKRADDPVIRNTVAVVDDQLSYPTANGRFWHRASFDGYGEQRDGSQWEPSDPGSGKTIGRGWPLLGGERGQYELQLDGMQATAAGRLDTMGKAADDASHLMAEQVWDLNPPGGTPGFIPGEPTLSAMPLAWTHAQFLRLARNLRGGTQPRDAAGGRLPVAGASCARIGTR